MSNPFSKAIQGVRVEVTLAIDVSRLLLGGLLDKGVITRAQHDQISVNCFTLFSA